MLSKTLLYLRTIKRMKPSMVFARLRGRRLLPEGGAAGEHDFILPRISIEGLDLDHGYLSRFDVDALLVDDFLLINECHHVDVLRWSVPEASHLWNFNLHYFEWGVALAARWHESKDGRYLGCFKRLTSSWIGSCPYPNGDAWQPYTISLRLINWLIAIDLFGNALQADASFFETMCASMYVQYRHLLINQETHLRANHWWENLKTLAIMAPAFCEQDVISQVMHRFADQLDEQILPDGVHFERSLMYHKLVLEGMLRVWVASKQLNFRLPETFLLKLKQMLDAMASLERGMGKTPYFNDSADAVAKSCLSLIAASKQLTGIEADDTRTAFPDAGYYKLYRDGIALMVDAGTPGPTYLLGHSHCDCLSYELSYKGVPVIVNSGTYAYQSDLRPYFRSTSAHNTCLVDDEEQLECWAEHRVARGYGNVVVRDFDPSSISASMTLPGGKVLCRSIELCADGIRVSDKSNQGARLDSFVHCPELAPISIDASHKASLSTAACKLSPEFSRLKKGIVTTVSGSGTVSYTIRVAKETVS